MDSNVRCTLYVIGALAAGALAVAATKTAIDAYRQAELDAAMFPGGPEVARELRRNSAAYPRVTTTKPDFSGPYLS